MNKSMSITSLISGCCAIWQVKCIMSVCLSVRQGVKRRSQDKGALLSCAVLARAAGFFVNLQNNVVV